jgi:ubiquinone/menaquinone biosynthesis C-methylase UbiE
MPPTDPYRDPDSQADATLQAMITRLEERGRHAGFSRMIRAYVAALPTDRPLTVLDLGCGTGVVARQVAAAAHPSSAVHGADVSNRLLNEARRLDPTGRIRWDHIRPGALPYGEATFDAVLMHTLLGHVPDPAAILAEAARVLRRGGRLIVFDADHAGTTYGEADYETTRRIDHLLSSAIATHPDVCRQMPRYLKAAHFKLTDYRADVIAECGRGDYWLSSVRGFARMFPTLGVLSPEEADRWVGHMLKSHEDGTFFAAGSFYTFHAERR